jgi:NADP-reducing hydrogenase subunit HndB
MPPVIYGNVDSAVAKEIISKHIIGRELLENRILDKPSVDIVSSK